VFLGKGRSDLQKPDGLVVITHDHLPDILLGLELQEIYGIGPRMEERLNRAGILTVAELWQATPLRLRQVWGGINGVLFHEMLHGADIQPRSSKFAKSMGHQHVLEPEFRTSAGAQNVARHLLGKGGRAAPARRLFLPPARPSPFHGSAISDAGGMKSVSSRPAILASYSPGSGPRFQLTSRCRSAWYFSISFPPIGISRICSSRPIKDAKSCRP
jgi:hypothetical protein